ncbi:hypothetical protein SEVIR_2G073450v4 [Setaria viridis]
MRRPGGGRRARVPARVPRAPPRPRRRLLPPPRLPRGPRHHGRQPPPEALHQHRRAVLQVVVEARGVQAPVDVRDAGHGPGQEEGHHGRPRRVPQRQGVLRAHRQGVEARVPPPRPAGHRQVLHDRRHGKLPRLRHLRHRAHLRVLQHRAPPHVHRHQGKVHHRHRGHRLLPRPHRQAPPPPGPGGDADDASKAEPQLEPTSTSKVTLSGLLNFIDGLWSACGGERVIVFTTNHADRLDLALIRCGRMDHIEMSYCCFESFRFLARNYLAVDAHPLFDDVAALRREVDITPADVAELLTPKRAGDDDAGSCLAGLVQALREAREATTAAAKNATSSDKVVLPEDEEVVEDE